MVTRGIKTLTLELTYTGTLNADHVTYLLLVCLAKVTPEGQLNGAVAVIKDGDMLSILSLSTL